MLEDNNSYSALADFAISGLNHTLGTIYKALNGVELCETKHMFAPGDNKPREAFHGPFPTDLQYLAAVADGEETLDDVPSLREKLFSVYAIMPNVRGRYRDALQQITNTIHLKIADPITEEEVGEILPDGPYLIDFHEELGHIHKLYPHLIPSNLNLNDAFYDRHEVEHFTEQSKQNKARVQEIIDKAKKD